MSLERERTLFVRERNLSLKREYYSLEREKFTEKEKEEVVGLLCLPQPVSVMTSLVKLNLTDLWTWYRTSMYIKSIGLGSSLLININCSVLDVKSFYLSHQQHLNQLEAAVEDMTSCQMILTLLR